MHSMEEVAGLLHIVEKTSDHGVKFANIRAAAMQKLSEIEEEHAQALIEQKKALAAEQEPGAAAQNDPEPDVEVEGDEPTGERLEAEQEPGAAAQRPTVQRRL